MFTVVVEYDDGYPLINLLYKSNDGIELNFYPEDIALITDIDICGDTGRFNSLTSNGICTFHWTSEIVVFYLGKYGGDAGVLNVKIPATSETITSLKQCLQTWKDAVVNMESQGLERIPHRKTK